MKILGYGGSTSFSHSPLDAAKCGIPSCVSQIYPGVAQICEGRLIFISQGLMAVRRLSHIRSFTLYMRISYIYLYIYEENKNDY